ncbi:hypothetical protein B0H10DRAFT_2431847 [Mycena sp. CBHHK59/15]|nr:hypothetical protein B0H10DRAFT_2431847 [Mycena sp. CBHHK59/15]
MTCYMGDLNDSFLFSLLDTFRRPLSLLSTTPTATSSPTRRCLNASPRRFGVLPSSPSLDPATTKPIEYALACGVCSAVNLLALGTDEIPKIWVFTLASSTSPDSYLTPLSPRTTAVLHGVSQKLAELPPFYSAGPSSRPEFQRLQRLQPPRKRADVSAPSNDEVAASLPSRTLPKNTERTARNCTKEKDQEKSSPAFHPVDGPSTQKQHGGGKRSPIYYFFEQIDADANGMTEEGASYYKYYLGNREIIYIGASARYDTSKLQKHLQNTFKAHFRLFQVLSKHTEPATDLERDLARGALPISPELAKEYKEKSDQISGNIKAMLEKQTADAEAPWDKDHFEELVAKWVAACDQPFIAANKWEFREMLRYTALHPAKKRLSIPEDQVVKAKIKLMEEEMVKELFVTFKETTSDFVLSLDAWTSSNGYAFMAIVIHYIGNDSKLVYLPLTLQTRAQISLVWRIHEAGVFSRRWIYGDRASDAPHDCTPAAHAPASSMPYYGRAAALAFLMYPSHPTSGSYHRIFTHATTLARLVHAPHLASALYRRVFAHTAALALLVHPTSAHRVSTPPTFDYRGPRSLVPPPRLLTPPTGRRAYRQIHLEGQRRRDDEGRSRKLQNVAAR